MDHTGSERTLESALHLDHAQVNALLRAAGFSLQYSESPPPPSSTRPIVYVNTAPPPPGLIVGREADLAELKARLVISTGTKSTESVQVLTAVRGLPGVGKTTITIALAHDPDVTRVFPDGVLWVSLGQSPNLFSELVVWGQVLGIENLQWSQTLAGASTQLRALLSEKRMLLIVDDVWEREHVIPFDVGGSKCAMLVTTREKSIADNLAPTPSAVFTLEVLTDEKALELLRMLAPSVVEQHVQECLALAGMLEGLPLALQVAGRLLHVEASYGFSITDLLAELREGERLLEKQAPTNRFDLDNGATPTLRVLLKKSTDRLDPATLDCFALLGSYVPKPATFSLEALKEQWHVDDPKPFVRVLVDRGLLERRSDGRFWLHALLKMHARSLLT